MFNTCLRDVLIHFDGTETNLKTKVLILLVARNPNSWLKMLHEEHGGNDEIVTIGLMHRDISTSIHGQYNYGIMGLSFRPGDACVVSTFRLKRKDDLWKVTIHEFLHSRGLPHCKKNAPKCLMQDAHGKNTFYMKHGLCEDCKNSLGMIMTH